MLKSEFIARNKAGLPSYNSFSRLMDKQNAIRFRKNIIIILTITKNAVII